MASRLRNVASIDEIKTLYNRAEGHDLFYDEGNEETRHLEAFLLQAALLEGVLTRLGLEILEQREDLIALKGKRKNRYGIDNAINDLYLLGEITTDEFSNLEKFKNKRNEYIHNLLSQNNDNIERGTKEIYENNKMLLWGLIEKIRDAGKTVVITTHYMDEAEVLCDRVAIMDGGEIIKLDTPDNLVDRLIKKGFTKKKVEKAANLEDVFLDLTGKLLREA